jgi:TPR repeat protein
MSAWQRLSRGFYWPGLFLVGVVLAVIMTSGAAAEPLDEGLAAYHRGDYATALRLWRPLAERGLADAQYNLGSMFLEGSRGVRQDDAEAAKWFGLAAEQGHTVAQFNLGVMYRKGKGVPQNDAEAMKWYRLAAEQGDAPSPIQSRPHVQ